MINIPELSPMAYTASRRGTVHIALLALECGQLHTILWVGCFNHQEIATAALVRITVAPGSRARYLKVDQCLNVKMSLRSCNAQSVAVHLSSEGVDSDDDYVTRSTLGSWYRLCVFSLAFMYLDFSYMVAQKCEGKHDVIDYFAAFRMNSFIPGITS